MSPQRRNSSYFNPTEISTSSHLAGRPIGVTPEQAGAAVRAVLALAVRNGLDAAQVRDQLDALGLDPTLARTPSESTATVPPVSGVGRRSFGLSRQTQAAALPVPERSDPAA